MLKRTLSDSEEPPNDENQRINRRMSLPVSGKKTVLHSTLENSETPVLLPSNRRHTLMPLRSILKAKGTDVTITGNRRVSFAGQVSVHKFQTSSSPRKKPKSSSPSVPSKLSIHEYMKKRGTVSVNVQDLINEMNDEPMSEAEREKQTKIDKEIAELHAMKYQNNDEIHEDNSTQTMEMSVELTNQIKEQQKAVLQQAGDNNDDNYLSDHNNEESDSFRELFEDFEQDEENNEKEKPDIQGESMDLTNALQPIPILESPEIERAILELNETTTMDLTEPIKQSMSSTTPIISTTEDIDMQDMEMTQPIDKCNMNELEIDDRTETMELTRRVTAKETLEDDVIEEIDPAFEIDDQTQTMNLTQIAHIPQTTPQTIMDESAMDLTIPLQHAALEDQPPVSSSDEVETDITFNPVPLSTVAEMSEPASIIESTTNDTILSEKEIVSTPPPTTMPKNDTQNNINVNSSVGEISFVTEMVPLADVSDTSLVQLDNFESADILEDDDNYLNVTLDTFLRDINVQFYESIGPSDREIQETMNIIINDSNIPADSPTTSSSLSTSSTPLKPQSVVTEDRRQTLLDYIDATNNILYYHYLNHIINQYRSSIGTISNMVNKFSDDVEESNLLTMREYYNQNIELKSDLRTNYQAIASFTRKQSQNENMQFISGLLEQLITSYEKARGDLSIELENAIDWRKDVLVQRQQMIEKKMDLSKIVERLLKVKNEWSIMDIPRWKDTNERIKVVSRENKLLEGEIKSLTEKKEQDGINLQELTDEKVKLVKEVNGLNEQLKSMKMPIDIELTQLTNQLKELEIKSGIRLISESPLEFIVNDDLKVAFYEADNEKDGHSKKVNIHILRVHHFKPFDQLAELFIKKFVEGNNGMESFTLVKLLKANWHKFKQLWKDLATIYYIYPTVINKDGLTVDFKFGKLKLNCTFDDLLDETKQIKVEIVNVDNYNDNKFKDKLENESWGKFELFKRLEYL